MAGVAFAVEGDGVGFATESYAASALYTTLASLSGALSRIRRARVETGTQGSARLQKGPMAKIKRGPLNLARKGKGLRVDLPTTTAPTKFVSIGRARVAAFGTIKFAAKLGL
jgi:hypothetical protein